MPATLNAEERSISSPTPFPLLAALTARLMVAACVILPAVPVTVSVENPVGVQGDAERCSHADCREEVGVRVAVTPLGTPDTAKLTFPWKPFTALILIWLTLMPL